MLTVQLKELTKTNHQSLEKKMVTLMKNMSSKADYAKMLSLFYSFFGGLELAMSQHPDLSFLPDQAQRRKSVSLANDLMQLNYPLPELAVAMALPEINNHLQTIGAMYVMEGSTLGGKFISKMISKQLDITDDAAFSFFNGYGEATENMWDVFKQSIEDLNLNDTDKSVVITSANDTFNQFSKWFDNHG